VFRVERRDGPAWVVRVFPPERPVHAVEGDAAIQPGDARSSRSRPRAIAAFTA
jgi:hypothetical protein